jgi:post-segregation antitoxin (ccd killing protein)
VLKNNFKRVKKTRKITSLSIDSKILEFLQSKNVNVSRFLEELALNSLIKNKDFRAFYNNLKGEN